jgi:hypothetical protein
MFESNLPGSVEDVDFIHGIERTPCTFTPGAAH